MYKRKLAVFAGLILFLLLLISALVAASTQITRSNLIQNSIAQSLLHEHMVVSSTSYRLFKQLTDELIFGKDANQAEVRNKRAIIDQSIAKIIDLEQKQRKALGAEVTEGSVEDTRGLVELLDDIIGQFNRIIDNPQDTQLAQQQRVQYLLEVTIDNRFREAINAALTRQSNVVASLNARIETLHQSIVWYSVLLAVLAIPLVIFGMYWLLGTLYQPLNSIRMGAEAIAQGNYQHRISRGFDAEFDVIAASFNSMAEQLVQQQANVESATKALEVEVVQRTSEISEANRLLQANDKNRREFLADISHELRTPLSIIRGEIQVTLRQKKITAEDYQTTLETVLDESLGLSRLVDDLLLIARAESGRLRIVTKMVELAPFISRTLAQLETLLSRKGVQIDLALEQAPPLVEIDPERIGQVIVVIVDNALNYAGDGASISIVGEVQTDSRDDTNTQYFVLRIRDNGRGIEQETLPFIFDRYFRGSDTRTGQGSGLGLAIAKAIVQAHRGTIEVTSRLNTGTEFVITLPMESPK